MVRAAVFTSMLVVFSLGCDRGHPRDGNPSKQPSPVPAVADSIAPACTLPPLTLRRPQPERLVAIGDLHGDLAATRSAFRAAGAIDDQDRWIGGKLVVVQTGDILDRGDDEQAILDLVFRLEGEAKTAGGELIMLIGNHELMNAAGDFRYVTRGAMTDFDDVPGLDPSKWPTVPDPARKRFTALAPGGIYAKKIAAHDVVAIIGDTVFSHAGPAGEFATQLEEINRSSRCWLDGQGGGPNEPPLAMTSEESPVWTRVYGNDFVDCGVAKSAIEAMGVKRIVVGHTVQKQINSACAETVWRIDVGLAKLYDGPIEVLEVYPTPKILRGSR